MRGFLGLISTVWLAGELLFLVRPVSARTDLQVRDLKARDPAELATVLTRSHCGIEIQDVRYVGDPRSAGTFTTSLANTLGFTKGVLITTGMAAGIIGPNRADTTGTDMSAPGDPDLDRMSGGGATRDAAALTIDFIPSGTTASFDYAFASDEYPEFIGAFPDVMAIFVNGVNYAFPGLSTTAMGVAAVNWGPQDTTWPHSGNNCELFRCNARNSCSILTDSSFCAQWDQFVPLFDAVRFSEVEYDGITAVESLIVPVNAGVVNTIKFVIGDVSDSVVDSAVLVGGDSFVSECTTPPTLPPAAAPAVPGAAPSAPMVAYPSPYRPGSGGPGYPAAVTLARLPAGATVRIYTIAGAPVATLRDEDLDGTAEWNVRNTEGRPVGSGVYLIVARGAGGVTRTARVVIVR